MNEIEVGKLAADFVAENVKSIASIAHDAYSVVKREVKLRLESSYRAYLEISALKYSRTKSFFIRDAPVSIYDFYVPISVASAKFDVEDPDYINLNAISNKLVIHGSGGTGKSVLMKHLFLSCIEHKAKVPVFIELRDLNNGEKSLTESIEHSLNATEYCFDKDYIEKGIKRGHFAFFLDGFDEVKNEIRQDLLKDIRKIASIGGDCTIILSSRPDETFSGIDEFVIVKIESLSLSSASQLVAKLPFDESTKEKFLIELKDGMYETHKSFLSNPLLLSIMLLTYGQNAEIPTKLSIFYNQAYEALFQRHDALKGGYKRARKTDLDIQDFAKIFSVFSLQTYDQRIFSMSRMDALRFINKSKSHLSISIEDEGFLEDSLKATCLLLEEGLNIVYSHRSFQEYFVAVYIANASQEVQVKLLSKYSRMLEFDSVIPLLHEIRPDIVERLLLIPKLEKLYESIGVKKKLGITHFVKYMKMMFAAVIVTQHTVGYVSDADYNRNNMFKIMHLAIKSTSKSTESNILGLSEDDELGLSEDDKRMIVKKYNPESSNHTRYLTKKLSMKSDLMKDLFKSKEGVAGRLLPLRAYSSLVTLQNKHSKMESTLDQLLEI